MPPSADYFLRGLGLRSYIYEARVSFCTRMRRARARAPSCNNIALVSRPEIDAARVAQRKASREGANSTNNLRWQDTLAEWSKALA